MASQERISVYNLADLKNTSDDAIPNYLNSLGFTQDHRLIDTRLALGYGAFVVAAACFAWDYQLGFEATKIWTAAAVALYLVLNSALTYWLAFVERGVIYQGVSPNRKARISLASSTKKNVPVYNLAVQTTDLSSKKKTPAVDLKIAQPFTAWFDENGRFVPAPFQSMLATAIPAVGLADPKRVAGSDNAATNAATDDDNKFLEVDPDTLDALASAEASGAAASNKKAKRRKA